MFHRAQDLGPCLPQAKVQRSGAKAIRLSEISPETALTVEKIASQKPRPIKSRVGRAMLFEQAVNPQARVVCRIGEQRFQLERPQAISNPEKRDSVAGKFGLRLRRPFPLPLYGVKECPGGLGSIRA